MWEIIAVFICLGLIVLYQLYSESSTNKNNREACINYINKNPSIFKAENIFYDELLKHSNELYTCSKCQNDFMQLWNLKDNYLEYRCVECKKKFNLQFSEESFNSIKIKANKLYVLLNKIDAHTNQYGHMFGWEGLRNGLKFNYEKLNKNQPYIRAIYFEAKGVRHKNENKRSRRISSKVKDMVWNRDNGRCVECGSNEKLEFDHIIPYSKGGANTYRNVQLLCETCNRKKTDMIG